MKQLTGRENYSKYWVYRSWLDADTFKSKWWGPARPVDAPKIPDPERLSVDVYNAIDAGGWYWEAAARAAGFRTINKFIATNAVNPETVKKVTYAINGGYNMLPERIAHTTRIANIILDL